MTDVGLQTTLTHFRSAAMIEKNISIAIVGSSGNLLDRRYGEAINGADVVIRINDAPTASGYQIDIGRGYPDRTRGLVRSGWGTGLHNAVSPSHRGPADHDPSSPPIAAATARSRPLVAPPLHPTPLPPPALATVIALPI